MAIAFERLLPSAGMSVIGRGVMSVERGVGVLIECLFVVDAGSRTPVNLRGSQYGPDLEPKK